MKINVTYSVKKLTRSARGASPSKLKAKIQGCSSHEKKKREYFYLIIDYSSIFLTILIYQLIYILRDS